MKRIISIILIALLVIIFILFAQIFLISVWQIGISQANEQETFLISSQSPDGQYNLEVYRTEPGATVDFSVKVYLVESDKKELIYNAYHEYNAEIIWLDNTNVSINGKILNLSCGEKYDWRTN